jgi:hypothetical protein
LPALQKRFSAIGIEPISAATGEGLDAFKTKLEQWLANASEQDPASIFFAGRPNRPCPPIKN